MPAMADISMLISASQKNYEVSGLGERAWRPVCEVSLAKPFWASLSPGVELDADVAGGAATTDVDNCCEEGFAELQVLLRSGLHGL